MHASCWDCSHTLTSAQQQQQQHHQHSTMHNNITSTVYFGDFLVFHQHQHMIHGSICAYVRNTTAFVILFSFFFSSPLCVFVFLLRFLFVHAFIAKPFVLWHLSFLCIVFFSISVFIFPLLLI